MQWTRDQTNHQKPLTGPLYIRAWLSSQSCDMTEINQDFGSDA